MSILSTDSTKPCFSTLRQSPPVRTVIPKFLTRIPRRGGTGRARGWRTNTTVRRRISPMQNRAQCERQAGADPPRTQPMENRCTCFSMVYPFLKRGRVQSTKERFRHLHSCQKKLFRCQHTRNWTCKMRLSGTVRGFASCEPSTAPPTHQNKAKKH